MRPKEDNLYQLLVLYTKWYPDVFLQFMNCDCHVFSTALKQIKKNDNQNKEVGFTPSNDKFWARLYTWTDEVSSWVILTGFQTNQNYQTLTPLSWWYIFV